MQRKGGYEGIGIRIAVGAVLLILVLLSISGVATGAKEALGKKYAELCHDPDSPTWQVWHVDDRLLQTRCAILDFVTDDAPSGVLP